MAESREKEISEPALLGHDAETTIASADPAFALDLVTGSARASIGLDAAMSNSFAFGGTNAVLVATRAAR